jgi:hypothetical protein
MNKNILLIFKEKNTITDMPLLSELECELIRGGSARSNLIQNLRDIISLIESCKGLLSSMKIDIQNFQKKCNAAKTVGTSVGVIGAGVATGNLFAFVGESYAIMRAKLSLLRKVRCSRVFAHVCVCKFTKMFQNLFDFCLFSTFSIVFLVQKVCFQNLLPS